MSPLWIARACVVLCAAQIALWFWTGDVLYLFLAPFYGLLCSLYARHPR